MIKFPFDTLQRLAQATPRLYCKSALCSVMRGACLFTNTLLPLKTYWLWGHRLLLRAGKALLQKGTEGILTEDRQLLCFLLLCFCLHLTWRFLRREDAGVLKRLLALLFFLLLLRLIDDTPISTCAYRGQARAAMPHSRAPPVARTAVMTNGKGHTLALCVPDAASCPVMDSPLCHHHLLLGLGQNQ